MCKTQKQLNYQVKQRGGFGAAIAPAIDVAGFFVCFNFMLCAKFTFSRPPRLSGVPCRDSFLLLANSPHEEIPYQRALLPSHHHTHALLWTNVNTNLGDPIA
jgi:hypothetical protein